MCYNQVIAHQCQSKTLSTPAPEATYTNKASLEAFAVCELTGLKPHHLDDDLLTMLWRCVKGRSGACCPFGLFYIFLFLLDDIYIVNRILDFNRFLNRLLTFIP